MSSADVISFPGVRIERAEGQQRIPLQVVLGPNTWAELRKAARRVGSTPAELAAVIVARALVKNDDGDAA